MLVQQCVNEYDQSSDDKTVVIPVESLHPLADTIITRIEGQEEPHGRHRG